MKSLAEVLEEYMLEGEPNALEQRAIGLALSVLGGLSDDFSEE